MTARSAIINIYIGYYNRAPDTDGLNYWMGRHSAGMSLAEIAASFSVQVESKNNYEYLKDTANNSPSDFLDTVYQNLFNRAPDAEGKQYWMGELERAAGQPEKIGAMILNIISGATTDPDKSILENKGAAADYWENKLSLQQNQVYEETTAASAKSVLNGITDDPTTISQAASQTDAFFSATVINQPESSDDLNITTGTAADSITSGSGNDTIASGPGDDTVVSGPGNDTINAGPGDDVIESGAGDDTVTIGDGHDVARTGPGNDTVIAGNSGGNGFIDGGDGINTISFASLTSEQYAAIYISELDRSTNPVIPTILSSDLVNLPIGTQVGIAQIALLGTLESNTDVLINFENVVGGASQDFIIGNDKDNVMDGGAGNDRLVSTWGNDTLIGGDGNDRLEPGHGSDTLIGGAGADTFVFDGQIGIGFEIGINKILDFSLGEDLLLLENGVKMSSVAELDVAGGSEMDTVVTLSTGNIVHLLGISGVGDGSSLFGV